MWNKIQNAREKSARRKYSRSRLIIFFKCLSIWNLNFSISLTLDVVCNLCFSCVLFLGLRRFLFRHPFRETNWHCNSCHFRAGFFQCILVILYECFFSAYRFYLKYDEYGELINWCLKFYCLKRCSHDYVCWKLLMECYSSRHHVNQVGACSQRCSVLEIQFLMQDLD